MKTLFVILLIAAGFAGLLAEDTQDVRLIELKNAIETGNMSTIRSLIDQGINISARFDNGYAPIHMAAFHNRGNVDIAEILIEHGADVNAKGYDNSTPLHIATWLNDLNFTKVLINHGADANSRKQEDQYGYMPIHYAASNGNMDITRLLIEHGADINVKSMNEKTAYEYALLRGNKEVAQIIKEAEEEQSIKTSTNSIATEQETTTQVSKSFSSGTPSHTEQHEYKFSLVGTLKLFS